jgi:hypothetical protein
MVALTARQQDSRPFFDKLPLEIRLLVYRELLVSEKTIVGLSMMVGKERLKRRMQSNYDPIPDVDAAIDMSKSLQRGHWYSLRREYLQIQQHQDTECLQGGWIDRKKRQLLAYAHCRYASELIPIRQDPLRLQTLTHRQT